MAYNDALTKKVRSALAHIPNVEEKKMFRGITFMVQGKMCMSAGDDEIMFRIDPALHAEAIAKQGARAMVMKGREYKGYINVKEDAIKSGKDLEYWVDLALEFNEKIKASKE